MACVLVYQNDKGAQDPFTKISFEIDYCASSLTIHTKDFESGCSSGVLTLNVPLAIQHAGANFIATMIVRNCGGTRVDQEQVEFKARFVCFRFRFESISGRD